MTDPIVRSAIRDSSLTPDAVAERSFASVKRGYAESEVRAFLRLVADDLAAALARERQLSDRVHALEAKLAAPDAPLSEQELFQALGEETARVLRSARESANEVLGKRRS